MRVRLHLFRIRVIEVRTDLPERLKVVIRDLPVVRCPFCGFKTTKVHETRRVKVRDIPRGPQKVTLIRLRRRFECTSCGERHTEAHPAIAGKMTTHSPAPSSPTPGTCRSPRSIDATGLRGPRS